MFSKKTCFLHYGNFWIFPGWAISYQCLILQKCGTKIIPWRVFNMKKRGWSELNVSQEGVAVPIGECMAALSGKMLSKVEAFWVRIPQCLETDLHRAMVLQYGGIKDSGRSPQDMRGPIAQGCFDWKCNIFGSHTMPVCSGMVITRKSKHGQNNNFKGFLKGFFWGRRLSSGYLLLLQRSSQEMGNTYSSLWRVEDNGP